MAQSHTERQQLRRKAADLVTQGVNLYDVARQLSRTEAWVRRACREFGVHCITQKNNRARTLEIYAAIVKHPQATVKEVAELVGVSAPYVRSIAKQANELGLLGASEHCGGVQGESTHHSTGGTP